MPPHIYINMSELGLPGSEANQDTESDAGLGTLAGPGPQLEGSPQAVPKAPLLDLVVSPLFRLIRYSKRTGCSNGTSCFGKSKEDQKSTGNYAEYSVLDLPGAYPDSKSTSEYFHI